MRLVFLLACSTLYGQIFPNTGTVVMSCGGRPAWVSPSQLVVDASTTPKGYPNDQPPSCTQVTKPPLNVDPLWDVYTLKQNPSGSWSDHPTELNITSGLKNHLLPQYASAGNPDSDGANLAFIAQTDAHSNFSPGPGVGYAIVLCNTLSPGTGSGTCCFNGGASPGCGVLLTPLNSGGASIDPHIDNYNGVSHVFWTERNPTKTSSNASCFVTNIVPWVEHYATVTWGTPGTTAPTVTADTQWCPQSSYFQGLLSNIAMSTDKCDEYFKATSVVHQADGTTTMYTQANQVYQYNVYTMGATPTCESLGLGIPTDGVENAGIMSFTMTSPPLGDVSKINVIWPPTTLTNVQCLTPSTAAYPTRYPHCYAEFPLSQNGEFMAIASNYLVPTGTVQLCGSQTTPFAGCSLHQLTEMSQLNLLDVMSYGPLTNLQEFGTAFQATWMPIVPCSSFPCYFGGFSHYSMLGSSLLGPNLAVSFQSSQAFASVAASEAVLFNVIYTGNYWGNWMAGGGAVIHNASTAGSVRW